MNNGYFDRKALKKALRERRDYMIKMHGREKYTLDAIAIKLSKDDSGNFKDKTFSYSAVQAWFSDTKPNLPNQETLDRLCQYLHIDLTDLLDIETDPNREMNKTEQIEMICNLTGISPEAAKVLIQNKTRNNYSESINLLLTDKTHVLDAIINYLNPPRLHNPEISIMPKDLGRQFNPEDVEGFNTYLESIYTEKDYISCKVTSFEGEGLMINPKKNCDVTIDRSFQLTAELIRMNELNKVTHALQTLAEKIDKESDFFD